MATDVDNAEVSSAPSATDTDTNGGFEGRAAESHSDTSEDFRYRGGLSSDDVRSSGSEENASECVIDFDDLSDDAEGTGDIIARPQPVRYVSMGSFSSFQEALVWWRGSSSHVYAYVTRYTSRSRHTRTYGCRSHVGCDHRVKITSVTGIDGSVTYEVSQGGRHSALSTNQARRGIHPRLVEEVDALLSVGWSGGELRTMLQLRYQNDATTLLLIPTARQLTNRKAYLIKNTPGGWVITDFATFNAWASTKMCTTRDRFDEVTELTDLRMDELIVLDTFNFPGEPTTFGVVVTSRRVFRNVIAYVRDQGDELVISTDGTYKLDYAGWTLIAVGTVRTRWVRQTQAQEFIPWFYVFVRTESAAAFHRLFSVARAMARELLDVDLNVTFATLDHSEPIALALEEPWPGIRLLSCWPHIARQTQKKRSLLSDSNLYDTLIKPQIDLLQAARTHEQFIRMTTIVTAGWINVGERDYADWFRAVYLTRRWECWHINTPGVTPNQNPIEAHHRVVNRTCSPSSSASTTGVLTQSIPRILKYDGDNLCPTRAAHVCTGPLIPEMIAKARRLVVGPNYRRVHRGRGRHRQVVAFMFNSRQYISEPRNVIGSPLTANCARRFASSIIGGTISGEITAAELRFEVLSLHCVRIIGHPPQDPFALPAVWEEDEVMRVRGFVRCSCKAHVRSGWICSHVLATLSIYRLINLDDALAQVPVRRGPGRPPTRGGALTKERPRRTL